MKYKFITIGEIMLRLTPPDYEKIRTATSFEARYGGSEANVALSLANLGVAASFFTVVPGNSLGKSAGYDLRKAQERAHLLEGLIIAQENIDEVIRRIQLHNGFQYFFYR